MTDTPSTLEEKTSIGDLIHEIVTDCTSWSVGHLLGKLTKLTNMAEKIGVEKQRKAMKQELTAFASEIKKQITFDMGEPDDISEEWDNGWSASSKNAIQSIDRILKTRYELMEGEKHD